MSSPDDQAAALRAALDAAIDELGDDSEEDDDEEDDDHYHDEDEDAADLSSVPSQVAASGHQQHSSQGPGTPKVSSPNRAATVVAPPSANPDVETSVAVHPSSDKQAAPATPQPPSAPTFLGPPRPPTTTDSHTKKKPPTNPDTLFMEMCVCWCRTHKAAWFCGGGLCGCGCGCCFLNESVSVVCLLLLSFFFALQDGGYVAQPTGRNLRSR